LVGLVAGEEPLEDGVLRGSHSRDRLSVAQAISVDGFDKNKDNNRVIKQKESNKRKRQK